MAHASSRVGFSKRLVIGLSALALTLSSIVMAAAWSPTANAADPTAAPSAAASPDDCSTINWAYGVAPTNGGSWVLADGTDSWTASLIAATCNPNVYTSDITFTPSSSAVHVSSVSYHNGVYTVTATSSAVGSYTLDASYSGSDLGTQPISFVASPQNQSLSFTTSPTATSPVPADGSSSWTGVVTLTDSSSGTATPVTGQTSSLQFATTASTPTGDVPTSAVALSALKDNGDGTYTVTFTTTTPGTYTVTPSWGSITGGSQLITFAVATPDTAASSLALSSSQITAACDGTASVTATATILDASGKPVRGATVSFSSTYEGSSAAPTTAAAMTNASGVATVTFNASGIGSAQMMDIAATVPVNGSDAPIGNSPAKVTFTPVPGCETPTMTVLATPTSGAATVPADGASSWTVTITMTSASGAPVTGLDTSAFTVTPSSSSVHVSSVTDNANGTYTALLTSTTPSSSDTVSVAWAGPVSTVTSGAAPTPFAAAVSPSTSTLALSATTLAATKNCDGSVTTTPASITATATALDSTGAPMQGVRVYFEADSPLTSSVASAVTDSSGVATATISIDSTAATAPSARVRAYILGNDTNVTLGSPATVTIDQTTASGCANLPMITAISASPTSSPTILCAGGTPAPITVTANVGNTMASGPYAYTVVFLTVTSPSGNARFQQSGLATYYGPVTDVNGVATATLYDSTPEQVTVTGQVSLAPGSPTVSTTATFTTGCQAPTSTSLALSVGGVPANNVVTGTDMQATASIQNPGPFTVGTLVTFTIADHNTGSVIGTVNCTTVADGTCSQYMPAYAAGLYDISATYVDQSTGENVPLGNSPQILAVTDAGLPTGLTASLAVDSHGVAVPCDPSTTPPVTASVTVTDSTGTPVPNAEVSFAVSGAASIKGASTATAVTDANGVASVAVTGQAPGTAQVSASVLSGTAAVSVSSSPATLTFTSSCAAPTSAKLATSTPQASFGTPVTATAQLSNAAGPGPSGMPVTFTVTNNSTGAAVGTSSCTTASNGVCTATLPSTPLGVYTVSATYPDPATGNPVPLTGTPALNVYAPTPPPASTQATLTATPSAVPLPCGNLPGSSAVSLTLTNAGSPVSGAMVTLTATGGATFSGAASTTLLTDNTGKATATLSGTAAGSTQVTASVPVTGGTATVSGSPATVMFNATCASPTSAAMSVPSATVNVGSQVTASAQLTGPNGPVEGVLVNFTLTDTDSGNPVGSASCTTDSTGSCSISDPAAAAGTYSLASAYVDPITGNPQALTGSPQTVTVVTPPPPDPNASSLGMSNNPSSGIAWNNTATATIVDSTGAPIAGVPVTFNLTGSGWTINGGTTATVNTDAQGKASVPVTTTNVCAASSAGSVSATVPINGTATPISGSPQNTVPFTGSNACANKATLVSVVPTSGGSQVLADGVDSWTATYSVYNYLGQPVTGITTSGLMIFAGTTTSGAPTTSVTQSVTDNGDGTYTVTLTSTTPGPYTVAFSPAPGAPFETQPIAFAAPPTVDPVASTLTVANGVATVTIVDTNGQPMEGQTVMFMPNANATVAEATDPVAVPTMSNGQTSVPVAVLDDCSATQAQVSAQVMVNGSLVNVSGSPATLGSSGSCPFQATLALSATQVTSGDDATATATLVNADNDPQVGTLVTFTVTDTDAGTSTTLTCTTGSDGTCPVTLPTTHAGTYTVAGSVEGVPFPDGPQTLTVIPAPPVVVYPDADMSKLTSPGMPGQPVVLATVVDSTGAPMSGVAVTFTTSTAGALVNGAVTTTVPTNDQGQAQVTVSTLDVCQTPAAQISATVPVDENDTQATISGSPQSVLLTMPGDYCGPQQALTIAPTSGNTPVVADGVDSWTATMAVTDYKGNPVTTLDPTTIFIPEDTNGNATTDVTVWQPTNLGGGVYQALLTSTTPGDYLLSNWCGDGGPCPQLFSFAAAPTPPQFDPAQSEFSDTVTTTWNTCLTQANTSVTALTLTARDTQGNLMTDLDVSKIDFTGSTSDVTFSSPVVNNGDGTYTVQVTHATGTDTASVSYDGSVDVPTSTGGTTIALGGIPPLVADPDYGVTTATVDQASVPVGSSATVTASYDTSSAPDPSCVSSSRTMQFTVPAGASVTVVSGQAGSPVTNADGSTSVSVLATTAFPASVAVTSDTPGTVPVQVDADSPLMGMQPAINSPIAITFTATASPTPTEPPTPTPAQATLSMSATTVPFACDSSALPTATASVTVTDATGTPTPDVSVTFTVSGASASFGGAATTTVPTDANGVATATLTGSTPGSVQVSASLDSSGVTVTDSPATVAFTAGCVAPTPPSFTLSTTTANVGDNVTATATVLDTNHVGMANVPVTFTLVDPATGSQISTMSCTTTDDGTCSVTVAASNAGLFQVKATYTDPATGATATFPDSPQTLTVASTTPMPDPKLSTLTASATSVPLNCDPTAPATTNLTVTLKDASGTPVADIPIRLTATGGATFAGGATTTYPSSDANGTIQVALSSTTAGAAQVTAQIETTASGGAEITGSPLTVTFTPATGCTVQSATLSLSATQAYVGDDVTATAHLTNPAGAGVSQVPVTIMFTDPATGIATYAGQCTTASDGTCPVTMPSAQAGTYNVSAMATYYGTQVTWQGLPQTLTVSEGTPPPTTPPTTPPPPPTPVPTHAALTLAPSSVPIPCTSATAPSSAASVTVTDQNGAPMQGVSVTFTATGIATFGGATTQTVPTDANGVATASLSSSAPGDTQVSATVASTSLAVTGSPATVTFTSSCATAQPYGVMSLSSAQVNQNDMVTVTVKAFNGDGTPLVGVPVNVTLYDNASATSVGTTTCTTLGDGSCAISTQATTVGSFDVSASFNDPATGDEIALQNSPQTLTVSEAPTPPPSTPSGTASPTTTTFTPSLTVSATQVALDSDVTATAHLSMSDGQPVNGSTVTFAVTDHATGTAIGTQTCSTQGDGTCSVTVPATTAGVYDLAVTTTDPTTGKTVALQNSPQTLTVSATPSTASASPTPPSDLGVAVLKPSATSTPAGGVIYAFVMVADSTGAPVAGVPVVFTVNKSATFSSTGTVQTLTATTDSTGKATAIVSDAKAEAVSLTASIQSVNVPGSPATLTFTAAYPAPKILSPKAGAVLTTTTPTISGTAVAGATVSVASATGPICTAIADATGAWHCQPIQPLTPGPLVLAAVASSTTTTAMSSAATVAVTVTPTSVTGPGATPGSTTSTTSTSTGSTSTNSKVGTGGTVVMTSPWGLMAAIGVWAVGIAALLTRRKGSVR